MLDYDAWIARLRPALGESLDALNLTITNEPSVQTWLHEASFEAAMSLEAESDIAAAQLAYAEMFDRLEARFPELLAAVDALTGGCGRLDLHWRPLSPQFSMLRVRFDVSPEPKVFRLLGAPTTEEAQAALDAVAAALPQGVPFPSRPHEAMGLVTYAGRCLPILARSRHPDDAGPARSFSLRPKGLQPLEDLAPAEAPHAVTAFFQDPRQQSAS